MLSPLPPSNFARNDGGGREEREEKEEVLRSNRPWCSSYVLLLLGGLFRRGDEG